MDNMDLELLRGLWPGLVRVDMVSGWYAVATLDLMRRKHTHMSKHHAAQRMWAWTAAQPEPADTSAQSGTTIPPVR